MWREVWTVLFVICLILSGTTSNVAATAQTMQIFHTFNTQLQNGTITISISNETPIDLNLTEIQQLQEEYQAILGTYMQSMKEVENKTIEEIKNSTIEEIAETLNMTVEELNEQFENLTSAAENSNSSLVNYVQLDNSSLIFFFNLTLENGTINTAVIRYVKNCLNEEPAYKVVITTVALREETWYVQAFTLLHYSSPEVNVSNWFGDWITLNYTHSLAEHYKYIAETLNYAVENIYASRNDTYSKYLTVAYQVLAEECIKLSETIETNSQLKLLNGYIIQAIALVVDPLDSWELAGLILRTLFLVINVAMTIAGAAWYAKVLFTLTHNFLVWLVLAYARDGQISAKEKVSLGFILLGILLAILVPRFGWWIGTGIAAGLLGWFIILIMDILD